LGGGVEDISGWQLAVVLAKVDASGLSMEADGL
jgi:hypothetical protein